MRAYAAPTIHAGRSLAVIMHLPAPAVRPSATDTPDPLLAPVLSPCLQQSLVTPPTLF